MEVDQESKDHLIDFVARQTNLDLIMHNKRLQDLWNASHVSNLVIEDVDMVDC
jgi:hypothetical protein